MKHILYVFASLIIISLCGCNSQNGNMPKLTQKKLDVLYQKEFDKYSDKLLGSVQFGFASLEYGGEIYTTGKNDFLDYVYSKEITACEWERSIDDYPVEKICEVYGQVFVKEVYGEMNDVEKYSDVYAWYDDKAKVEGVMQIGTLWKFGEYDSANLVALTVPKEDEYGNTIYKLMIFYHLNNVNISTGKDLLNIVLNPENAQCYTIVGKPDSLKDISGEKVEDKFFLNSLYQSKVVSEKMVSNVDQYDEVVIVEKEPYRRRVYFRDYGDGVIGFCTPEETMIYFKIIN